MAFRGSDAVGIKVSTTSSTASFEDISQWVTDFSGLEMEAMIEETHAFGDSWKEQTYAGVKQVSDITLSGPWSDAASGFIGNFSAPSRLGTSGCLKVNYGTTNSYPKVDFVIKSFSRSPSRGALTKGTAVLAPSGAVTIGTT